MVAETSKEQRHIAWNGLRIDVPFAWDARVLGQRHLVFENDFQPQLQIRWEQPARHHPRALETGATRFAAQMGSIIPENRFPQALQQLKANFAKIICYENEAGMVTGGTCQCAGCHTVLLFQLLCDDRTLLTEAATCLSTILCHDNLENLWRIQDFSLSLPITFSLQDYTFGSGLTRLSFHSEDLCLQTGRIGPADTRLNRQSLAEILLTLTGTRELEMVAEEDGTSCTGNRNPSILRQIFFRLRREKPFISAKIRHDTGNNRLLAVVLSANRPIPLTATEDICRRYEII
jgi:hypothetical protein